MRQDNTVTYQNVILQIPERPERVHFVRCPVIVHQFPNGTLGVSYQDKLLGQYEQNGKPYSLKAKKKAA